MYATHIDHSGMMERVRHMDEIALRHVIKDCHQAIEAMPEGHKAGYYADEAHYCGMELVRREKNAQSTPRKRM
jgi:hypothetical protein